MPIILAVRRLEFKASLRDIVKPCLKRKGGGGSPRKGRKGGREEKKLQNKFNQYSERDKRGTVTSKLEV